MLGAAQRGCHALAGHRETTKPPQTQHMKRLLPPLLFGSLSLTFPCLPPHVWDQQFLPFPFDSIQEQGLS